jgi:pimeloyl-ACP methyl ester carboxylesterase
MTNNPIYRSEKGRKAIMAAYDAAVARAPVPYESRTLNTRHGETHVLVGGPSGAPPLLLFHSWNGSAGGIGHEFPFLLERYRVYMPDIIGHPGRSAPTRLDTAGAGYAEWAADLLDALKLPPCPAVGISGGGWMTLKITAHLAGRVTRAAAVSTDGLAHMDMLNVAYWMLPSAVFPSPYTVRRFYRFVTSPRAPYNPEAARRFCDDMLVVLRNFRPQGNPGLISDEELGRITPPTLVLMGEDERAFPPRESVLRAHARIPGLVAAELVPRAGHLMTVDQPKLLKEKLLAFLDAT